MKHTVQTKTFLVGDFTVTINIINGNQYRVRVAYHQQTITTDVMTFDEIEKFFDSFASLSSFDVIQIKE